ncbi:hypothetical protein BH10PSE3_BH10PSE3_31470 [soil metagenome]
MGRAHWINLIVGVVLAVGLSACGIGDKQSDSLVPKVAGHPIIKVADCLAVPAPRTPAPQLTAARASADRFDCGLDSATCGAWRRFRGDHPYPYQAFAGQRLAGGKAVLVLSEPPPGVTRAAAVDLVKAVLADRAPTVQVARWMIGSDGYVEDVVATFDAPDLKSTDLLSDDDLRSRLSLLQQAWFGTSCGGDVEVIGEGLTPREAAAPNLKVSAAELIAWMKDPKLLWTRVEDEAPLGYTWDEVSGDPALVGAFVSADQSLALFTFDKTLLDDAEGLAGLSAAFRRFAVSSDAIIGAVSTEDGRIGLVGRGRTHALSEVPPLRFETFALIAAQHGDQLSQSYERTNPFAGKMDDRRDWAPIYLSPALIDSELGSLLNVTDQLLKSWSQAGTVNYIGFNYPRKPKTFPFPQPLSHLVQAKTGSEKTLFNWNTSGSAVAVQSGDLTVLTSRQLGALPVTYGSELQSGGPMETGHLVGFEDTAYDYFASQQDPNLARVVQYTLIYQALRNLAGTATSASTADPVLPQKRYLANRMKTLLAGLNAEPSDVDSLDAFIQAFTKDKAHSALSDFERAHPDIDRDQLSLFLVDNTALYAAVNSSASSEDADKLLEDCRLLSNAVGDVVQSSHSLDDVRAKFEQAANRPVAGWIRTPSLVISWVNTPRGAMVVGGHNLRARALKIESSADVQGVQLMEDGRIAYGPGQAQAVESRAAELARTVEHKGATQVDIDRIMATAAPTMRARPVALALADAPRRPPVARLGGRTFETTGDVANAMRTLKAENKCCRFAMEAEDGRIYLAETNLAPPPTERVVAFGDTASLGPYLKRNPGRPPQDLIMLGQHRSHVDAMLASFEMPSTLGQGWGGVVDRMRGGLFRSRSTADHLISRDFSGRPGAVSVTRTNGSVAERTARLESLQGRVRSPGEVAVLDPGSINRLLEPLEWNVARDGQAYAVRVPFGSGAERGELQVVAGFVGDGMDGAKLGKIVGQDLAEARRRKATLAQAMISIENRLRALPGAHLRRVAMHVRKGAVQTQTTQRSPLPDEAVFG